MSEIDRTPYAQDQQADQRAPDAGHGPTPAPATTMLGQVAANIGQRTLQRKLARRAMQRRGTGAGSSSEEAMAAAEKGTSGASGPLPHLGNIQRSFGGHDVSQVKAHTDGAAAQGAEAMGAEAFATGDHVAFASAPSLHTAAHEAAHVVQQRAGVHLKGGVGEAGDSYEQHADAVADAVVRGESAEALLGPVGGESTAGGVQRQAVQMTQSTNPMPEEPDEEQAKEGVAKSPDVSKVKAQKSKSEMKALEQAVTDALGMVTRAAGNCALDNPVYTLWLDNGAKSATADEPTKARVQTVKSGFLKLKESFENDKITFKKWDLPDDHKLKFSNTFAYVRGGEKENAIYLGGAFWVAKNIGIDSKAGTIVHEMTHRLLKTKDHSYGAAASKDNATNSPAVAAENADNLEHLAESS